MQLGAVASLPTLPFSTTTKLPPGSWPSQWRERNVGGGVERQVLALSLAGHKTS